MPHSIFATRCRWSSVATALLAATLVTGVWAQTPPADPPAAPAPPASSPDAVPPTSAPATPSTAAPDSGYKVIYPENKPAEVAPPENPLAQFAWLAGCWRGAVSDFNFREHWMPPGAELMLGASHTMFKGKTRGFEYLRLEVQKDGVYYVNAAMGGGQKETVYKLVDRAMDQGDEVFTFTKPTQDFREKILYRRTAGGALYATVAGKVDGTDKQVIYPMKRAVCETGEPVDK